MTLEEQKSRFLQDLTRDLGVMRLMLLPQIAFLFVLAGLFAFMSVFGLYHAISSFAESNNAEPLKKAASVFIGGSATVGGLPLFKILPMIRENCTVYIKNTRTISAFSAKARNSSTHADYKAVVQQYLDLP